MFLILQSKIAQEMPIHLLEKETVRLESKCKQMQEWKKKGAATLTSHDYILKVSYKKQQCLIIGAVCGGNKRTMHVIIPAFLPS